MQSMRTATRAASGLLYLAYLAKAALWLGFGCLLLGVAVWLAWPDAASWFWDIVALLFGWKGCECAVTGLEQFVGANSNKQQAGQQSPMQRRPPDEREAGRRNDARQRR